MPDLPSPDISGSIVNSPVWQWRHFILAMIIATIGVTLAIAGPVLLVMMALSGELLAVVAASAMLSVGIALTFAVYLWLTV